ncbi:MAG: GNAT family N-acetyltransferase [Polyangiaceae bacterium]|nr:GNAT family N-acetyltransferase [Polyangiaceae bacterium]
MAEMSVAMRERWFQSGLPEVEGRGLRLRSLGREDAEDVYRLYCDREAVRFGYAPRMVELSDAVAVIDETRRLAAEKTIFHWGVASAETGRIIGHATLFHVDWRHRRGEIGYSVLRDLWGQGVGTRVVRTLLEFSFGSLDLRRMEADVDPRNVASLRLLEKVGFRREGLFRERWEIDGELQDGVALALLRSEWGGAA